MPGFFKGAPPQLSPEKEAEWERERYRDLVWENFIFSGEPETLATYLELGGEIDDQVRSTLVSILRGKHKPNNKGGKNARRDAEAFLAVKLIMVETGLNGEEVSKTEACKRHAKATNQELRAVEKQYERGKLILNPKSSDRVEG